MRRGMLRTEEVVERHFGLDRIRIGISDQECLADTTPTIDGHKLRFSRFVAALKCLEFLRSSNTGFSDIIWYFLDSSTMLSLAKSHNLTLDLVQDATNT